MKHSFKFKIMVFFRKYFKELIIVVLLIGLYFGVRLPNLLAQPIFADEAIYVRWAQVMRAEPTLRFLPLSDGKTPLYMWMLMPVFKIIEDPLLAGRLLSVAVGMFTVLGLGIIGWMFFNKRVGVIASILGIFTPYIVFFDRMALVDSMLSGFTVWALLLGLLVVKYKRLDLAMILGVVLGGGILTKTPGMFNFLMVPVGLLGIGKGSGGKLNGFIRVAGLLGIGIIIGMVIYNLLRLGPGFVNLSSRNQDYVHSPARLLIYPLDPFIPHLKDMMDWFPRLLTWPILIAVAGGIVLIVKSFKRVGVVILLWSLIPLLVEMALLQTFTTRYILFSIPPLLILAAVFIDKILVKRVSLYFSVVVMLIILSQAIYTDYLFLFDQYRAPLPRESRRGYFEDWTAGYGLKEIAEYLKTEAKNKEVIVATEGFFGTLPDGLWIYLDKEKNITVIGSRAEVSEDLYNFADERPTYFVANKSRVPVTPARLRLIKEYPKAVGVDIAPDAMLFFEILPSK